MTLYKKILALICSLTVVFIPAGCRDTFGAEAGFSCETFPLERNGIPLHLDCVIKRNTTPSGQILLVHGSTYSSHEFDIDYQDYSLVRRLAGEGYAVWRIDIAGYGRSGPVEDGFMPDTAYAAEDINTAVEEIVKISGQSRIDVLGWSWGTMTAGRFAAEHPEHLRKLILYAPVLIEMFCSSCWHYDGDSSPRGWSKDAFVDESTKLVDLERISSPTLIIYGNKDPYVNADLLGSALDSLPEGSELHMLEGGSHIMIYERPFYREFQNRIVEFLLRGDPFSNV